MIAAREHGRGRRATYPERAAQVITRVRSCFELEEILDVKLNLAHEPLEEHTDVHIHVTAGRRAAAKAVLDLEDLNEILSL